jgi:hypothetical protein
MLLALAGANHGAAQKSSARDNDPDLIEIEHYKLSMDKVTKLAAATEALNKLVEANPALKKQMDAEPSDNMTIDQKVKHIEAKFPQAAAAVHISGLSTREYMVGTLAFISDVMYVGMKKGGMMKDYPPNSITAENAAFVEANYEKLKAIGEKMTPKDR